VSAQGLEQLVHKVPEARHFRKLGKFGPGLIILALAMIGGGTALFALRSVLGLVLPFGGVLLAISIVGGPGAGWGGRGDAGARRAMRRTEVREKEKERKRQTGGED